MARPRADGTPAREVNRRKLTDLFVSTRKADERDELIWDAKQPGLALSVRKTAARQSRWESRDNQDENALLLG